MIITWLGLSCFKIQDKEITILLDPYTEKSGLKLPRLNSQLVITSTLSDLIDPRGVTGTPEIITGPGEYEIQKTFIWGLGDNTHASSERTLYLIQKEGMSLGFLGTLNHSINDEQLEMLEGADILLLPVGGNVVLDAEQAVKVASQIEPRIVIPMFYKIPGLKLTLDSLEKFAKEMGIKKLGGESKLSLAKEDLPIEGTKTIILLPQV